MEVELKAFGIACLGQKLLGLFWIVLVFHHPLLGATELRRIAYGVNDTGASAHQVLYDGLPVNRMGKGLADLNILEWCVGNGIEIKKADAHGFSKIDVQIWHLGQLFRLILGHVPDPVKTARHQLGHLGRHFRNRPLADFGDGGLALGAAIEVIIVLDHGDRFTRHDLDHFIRASADGFDGKGFGADLGVVIFGIDWGWTGQILEGGREGFVQVDADLVRSQLLGVFDPVDVSRCKGLSVRITEMIEGVDHVIGIELLAIVELDALRAAQPRW